MAVPDMSFGERGVGGLRPFETEVTPTPPLRKRALLHLTVGTLVKEKPVVIVSNLKLSENFCL